jgi:hypothetical protein
MTTATLKSVDDLGTMGANAAMKAAADYVRTHGLIVDVDALVTALRTYCREALDTAMADAKEAVDCGMYQAALATFTATFRLAGINAAKSITGR